MPAEVEQRERTSSPSSATPGRLLFLDGLRGIAIILMVVNHTSRWWIERDMGWSRYYLVYGSVILPAAIFLFLVGFCLPIPYHRRAVDQGAGPGCLALLRQYGPRGLRIIGAGLLLNVLVLRDDRWWSGGVLQTIGLAIVLLAPLMPLLGSPAARAALLALAAAIYVAFALANPAMTGWVARHEVVAKALVYDFPPWPWVCAALIGLVLGWCWLEARRRGRAAEARYFRWTAGIGAAALAAYAVWEISVPTSPRFGFPRDFVLNRHWTPRGATLLLIAAGVALLLAGTYWLMQVRGWRLPWLVVLGQTALMLYFVHQVIVYTIVNQWLGVRFTSWSAYWLANAALMVALVSLGRAWLAIRAGVLRPPRRA
jgi:uncharacterized membrane protein